MKKATKILIPIFLSLAIIFCLAWYLFQYDREFTRDMLIYGARYFETKGNHSIAEWFYDRAYEHVDDNDAVAIELAMQHKSSGNYTKAESTLSKAIEDGGGIDLYIALCKLYVEQDKLLDAEKLLSGVRNPDIKSQLDVLRPAAPATTHTPGFYSQYIQIDVSCESGTLYVNSNGEYPSVHSDVYAGPISLVDGENAIYAISVAENGLVSPLSIFGYTVGGVVEAVTFTDASIEAQIRALLNVSADHVLFTNDLWDITSFIVPADAKTITDLKFLPFLENLQADHINSGELGIVSSLSNLSSLQITNTSVSSEELAIIGALPKLERLTLSNCSLSTIAGLEKATGLTYLDLSNNTIRNIDALSTMQSLNEIKLQHNALTDLSALLSLASLSSLDVSYNAIVSIAPIFKMTGLHYLDASYNQLTDVSGIENLNTLDTLYLAHNSISDISALSGCTRIKTLDISNNAILDITALSTLTQMALFNFSYNQITELPIFPKDCALVTIDGSHNQLTSLENLSGLEHLNSVFMDYNEELESVEPLAICPVLIQVHVYGTKVTEVRSLTDQSIIVNYDPTQK